MVQWIKSLARHLPLLRDILAERDHLRGKNAELARSKEALRTRLATCEAEYKALQRKHGFVPPGHFYSPIPDFRKARATAESVFKRVSRTVPGLNMREAQQRALLERLVAFYDDMNFPEQKQPGIRYHYENPAYSYSDAILLHCLMRELAPVRIIEIGSGYSSCMMLDTNEAFFEDRIETTFIEPFPELLVSLLEDTDLGRIRLLDQPLQDVPLDLFEELQSGDILFIDSTHVSRIGSDVNRIIFEILPCLNPGVYVHFHDIFFPFEYPVSWVEEGRAWNEAYLLRAFLTFNPSFQIVLMNTFMHRFHREFFEQHMPLTLRNTGGSIWLRRTED
ncbi:MAG: class I SAM-dependent methyltransferase [Xanthomonadales bacterium]|nr:class I SAM-dependent methyltransferase [Xanthomonadales bacterium]